MFDGEPKPQMGDMWILSLPSFTWIPVVQEDAPAGRSGHTCHVIDDQMVVVGGYTGEDVCDSPGIYVFDTVNLEWKASFDAPARGSSPTTGPGVTASDDGPTPTVDAGPSGTGFVQWTNDPSITTMWTSEAVTATLADGRTSVITTAFETTATASSTGTSAPLASATRPTSTTRIAAAVGGSLGAIILVTLGLVIFTLTKRRRKPRQSFLIHNVRPISWVSVGGGQTEDNLASPWSPVTERGWPASDDAESETREWDVSEWNGDVLFSPRRSLRVVNE